MGAPRFALAVVVASALLLPLAAAGSAHGQLRVAGEATLAGDATLDAPRADVLWNASDAPMLQLSGTSFTVEAWGENATVAHTPLGDTQRVDSTSQPTRTLGAGTLTLEKGSGAQVFLLRSDAPIEATLADVTLRPVTGVMLASGGDAVGGAGCEGQPRCLDDAGVYELAAAAPSRAVLAGDIILMIHGPTAVLRMAADGSEQRVATGAQSTDTAAVTQRQDTWARVHVTGASGALALPGAARWYAPTPALRAAEARADATTGSVSVGVQVYRAAAEALDVRGALQLTPGTVAEGERGLSAPKYADAFDITIAGDVQSINLRSTPVYEQPAAGGVGALALAAAALGALAYYWPLVSFHATAAALPLYSRLKQPEILANEVRNAIYEIIRAHPGISAREVHRQSDQSWGTVVYHLRQLERHQLVVSRTVGRTRNYYENHGKYRGMEVQLACLQSPRARTLARIVLESPGITQEDLAVRSAFPQPTTSYYVRKLKAAGLVVEAREGRYARYQPMPELARFLELSESEPAAAAGPSDAVQA